MNAATLHRSFAALASLIVGVAVIWGFTLVGSPAQERLRKLDERRIRDLQAISRAVRALCVEQVLGQTKLVAPLPKTLTELDQRVRRGDVVSLALSLKDPQTDKEYGYRVVDDHRFELCADFQLARERRVEPFWNHAAGTACFAFDLLEREKPPEGQEVETPEPPQ